MEILNRQGISIICTAMSNHSRVATLMDDAMHVLRAVATLPAGPEMITRASKRHRPGSTAYEALRLVMIL